MNEKREEQGDRRVRRTKKMLRQGLSYLLTQKKLKDISVRELTDFVDLHRATFYVHYRDIYDLYQQIEEETVADVREILERFPAEKLTNSLYAIFLAMVQYIQENADLCRMLLSRNGDMTFYKRLEGMLQDKCVNDWMGLYKATTPQQREYCGSYIVSGCVGVMYRWLNEGMKQQPEQVAFMMEQMTRKGVGFLEEEQRKALVCPQG